MQETIERTGYVKWPGGRRYRNQTTHDRGMWVCAFIRARYNLASQSLPILEGRDSAELLTFYGDEFIRCVGPDSTAILPALDDARVVSANVKDLYPPEHLVEKPLGRHVPWEERERYLLYTLSAGAPVLAAVCLGTTNTAWTDPKTGEPWQATFGDLTRPGKRLVRGLEALYDRAADIVTYLDTP